MTKDLPTGSNDDSVSSAVGDDAGREEPLDDERNTLARTEDKAVRYLRWAVLLVLLVTASIVSTGCLLFMKADQQQDFEVEFEMNAKKILTSFQQTISMKLEAMDALSVDCTCYARSTGAVWPNVTFSDFEIRGANTRILANTGVINYSPVVTDETRSGWEAYAIENRDYFDVDFESEIYQISAQDEVFNVTKGERRNLKGLDNNDLIYDLQPDGSSKEAVRIYLVSELVHRTYPLLTKHQRHSSYLEAVHICQFGSSRLLLLPKD